MKRLLATLLACAASVAQADEQTEAFVEANLLSIFYHELGHAIIDVMQLPIFGQEEDAADTASILLIDATFDDQTAIDIAYDVALGFQYEADSEGDDIEWANTHGTDAQRFYNLVCIFYGADPENRADFASDMNLPAERAETCEAEFELADESWGPVFEAMGENGGGTSLHYEGPSKRNLTVKVINARVEELNTQTQLPQTVKIVVESCGEANAFYDPETRRISICTEFETHLREIAQIAG